MNQVEIVEVGLRDGLQNEKVQIDVASKIELFNKMYAAGIRRIEVGAFVSPKWVPQMAGSDQVIDAVLKSPQLKKKDSNLLSALVPNLTGMEAAMRSGIKEVAVFVSVSETFSMRNTNCSVKEGLQRASEVIAVAKKNGIRVRGYLSVCFGCPFEGKVSEEKVVRLAYQLYKMGCFEVSIGDTIGIAHPAQVTSLFGKLKKRIPVGSLAGHFHDTRGTALVNIYAAFQLGVRVFDTSLGGLGGCPYAPGSAGNVATEDVVYMFNGMKIKTSIDLQKILEMGPWLTAKVQHPLPSKLSKVASLQLKK